MKTGNTDYILLQALEILNPFAKHDNHKLGVKVFAELMKRQSSIPILSNIKLFELSNKLISSGDHAQLGHSMLAGHLLATKRFDEAFKNVQTAILKGINCSKLIHLSIEVCCASGEPNESLKYCELLLKHYPNYWQGYKSMSKAKYLTGDKDESKRLISRGLELVPEPQNSLSKKRDLSNFNHSKIVSPPKKLIFVAGLPRSGATVLGRILNMSKELGMLIEASGQFNMDTEALYNPKLLLDSSRHGNYQKYKINERLQKKGFKGQYLGDKQPNFEYFIEATYDKFSRNDAMKVVFISRPISEICASHYQRCTNPLDRWPLNKGIVNCVINFNTSCWTLVDLHKRRKDVFSRIHFAWYESLFTNYSYVLDLFDDLGLTVKNESRLLQFIARGAEKVVRKRYSKLKNKEEIDAAINQYLDFDLYKEFVSITGFPYLL